MDAGKRFGPPGTPTAFETHFGWVLAGSVDREVVTDHLMSHHVSLNFCEDILRRFWELKDGVLAETGFSLVWLLYELQLLALLTEGQQSAADTANFQPHPTRPLD